MLQTEEEIVIGRPVSPLAGLMGRRQKLRTWTSLKHVLEAPDAPAAR